MSAHEALEHHCPSGDRMLQGNYPDADGVIRFIPSQRPDSIGSWTLDLDGQGFETSLRIDYCPSCGICLWKIPVVRPILDMKES